jgi:hypothetical protein
MGRVEVKAGLPDRAIRDKLRPMKRLSSMWKAVSTGRHRPSFLIRTLSILSFAAVLGTFIARGLRSTTLADFLAGAAVSLSGILMMQVFSLRLSDDKEEPDESQLTELHLSH